MTPHSLVARDIPFAHEEGYRPVSLDLHQPNTDGPAPVVLELHGGGWRAGSRAEFTPLVTEARSFGRICAAGFAVVAADYRLSGEACFPAQLDDVDRALAWIHEHGPDHGLDPSRVVLWGGSAGGTLAALAGLKHDSQQRASVRGVIDWYGPSDLFGMAHFTAGRDPVGESREDLWLGAPVESVPDRATAASPARLVSAGIFSDSAPPFHLAHGADDTDVPPAQSETLASALRAHGVAVELHIEPNAGHFWRGASNAAVDSLFDRAIDFATRMVG